MANAQLREHRHIFVSPHLDDGVFSCGGRINQLSAAGAPVTVMTMMGGLHAGPLPKSPILADLHERWGAGADSLHPLRARQDEDRRALALLNADLEHISLTDCVYRQAEGMPLYPSEASLFGSVHPADYALEYLKKLSLPNPAQPLALYVPLGVGNHVDHQITRDWGLGLLGDWPDAWRFFFYAEYPYFNTERAIAQALAKLDLPLREQRLALAEADLAAKIKAIACYESQISTFWQSLRAMAEHVRRSSLDPQTSRYVERYWQIAD